MRYMRYMRSFSILLFMLIPVFSFSQITDIGDLHQNDEQGVPSLFGEYVTVQGIVTSPVGTLSDAEIHIQDLTGGITIYGTIAGNPQLGDEMEIVGQVDQFNGLTELKEMTQMDVLSQNNSLPQPLILTCAEVEASFDPNSNRDDNEGRLIQINQAEYQFDYFSGSNILGTLTDDTGTCTIFIDITAELQEPQSGTLLDVVGILKQYDTSLPYTEGYQIVPQFQTDFIYGGGPQITIFPHETDIQPDQVSFGWETEMPCPSSFEYGLTTSYELGRATPENYTTVHEATVTNLSSATVYHFRAIAEDDQGVTYSPDLTFASASALSSGEISVYFSKDAETQYADPVEAETGNLSSIFIQLIDNAQTSVDVCFYNISRQGVANSLINARNRGVAVRIIYEEENHNEVIDDLIDNGMQVINEGNSGHFMHNKFAVVDHADNDESNDAVWTGSWNASFSGTYYSAEHGITIRDAALAAAYSIEFEEMWAGDFGQDKQNNTPHLFNINGMWVEQYMSPSDGLNRRLTKMIRSGDHDLFFCIYNFTLNNISDEMEERFLEDVNVRGVFDQEQAGYQYSEWDFMSEWADVYFDNVDCNQTNCLLHHKYLVVDPFYANSDPLVVTGSYNWTAAGSDSHDENMIIFHDATIANIFFQEFMARYHEAGGEWAPLSVEGDFPPDPTSLTLRQSYPNPFMPKNGETNRVTFAFNLPYPAEIDVGIFDASGRHVKRAASGEYPQGRHEVAWDGRNAEGKIASAGVYFYQLTARKNSGETHSQTRRLVLMPITYSQK